MKIGNTLYNTDMTPGGGAGGPRVRIPITDLGTAYYKVYQGGLYPGGTNTRPASHVTAGATAEALVIPRDSAGASDPTNGKIVLLAIGMSNSGLEFCHATSDGSSGEAACETGTFMEQADSDGTIDAKVVIVNGAEGGRDMFSWNGDSNSQYVRVRDTVLPNWSMDPDQVQVIWTKAVVHKDNSNQTEMPSANSKMLILLKELGNVAREARVWYPQLAQIFFSPRMFAGYADNTKGSSEPTAYETGFAVKRLVEAQIVQRDGGGTDSIAGDLLTACPFIDFGPYMWSYTNVARNDGLQWLESDFTDGGVHGSAAGNTKWGDNLLSFFKTDASTDGWFLA